MKLLIDVLPLYQRDEEVNNMTPEKLNVLALVKSFGHAISLKGMQVLDHPYDDILDAFQAATLQELDHHNAVGEAPEKDLVELREGCR